RGLGDVRQAGAHHRSHRGDAAAAAQLRNDGNRAIRPVARSHLAADSQGTMRVSMPRPTPAAVRWMILGLLLLAWELLPLTGLLPELFLPALSKTLSVLYSDRHIYLAALLVTLYEVACAMLIACGLGILAGALVGGMALLRELLLPVFSSLYAVP